MACRAMVQSTPDGHAELNRDEAGRWKVRTQTSRESCSRCKATKAGTKKRTAR